MLQLTSKIGQVDSLSRNYDFQQTAIAHSLPQALFAWALLLLVMQAFLVTFADLPLPLILAMFLLVAAVLIMARKVVYPTRESSRIQHYQRLFLSDFSSTPSTLVRTEH